MTKYLITFLMICDLLAASMNAASQSWKTYLDTAESFKKKESQNRRLNII